MGAITSPNREQPERKNIREGLVESVKNETNNKVIAWQGHDTSVDLMRRREI